MKNTFKTFLAAAIALPLLTACSFGSAAEDGGVTDPDKHRISEGRISVEVPKTWVKNEDFEPTENGFTVAYSGDEEGNVRDVVRLSSDQGQGLNAEATMGYFKMNAQFNTTHGTEFELGESKDLVIENADQANLTTWTTVNSSTGETINGAWIFVSSDDSASAAGVEILSITLSPEEVAAMAETVQFDPNAG